MDSRCVMMIVFPNLVAIINRQLLTSYCISEEAPHKLLSGWHFKHFLIWNILFLCVLKPYMTLHSAPQFWHTRSFFLWLRLAFVLHMVGIVYLQYSTFALLEGCQMVTRSSDLRCSYVLIFFWPCIYSTVLYPKSVQVMDRSF